MPDSRKPISMAFEKFNKHGESFTPRVSIWKNGTLGMSAGAFNLFELTDRSYVVLLFDRQTRRVGLRFSHKAEEPGSLKMTVRRSGGVIPCKSFLDYYGIDYSVVRQYVLGWSEDLGLFVFDLDLPIEDDDMPEYPHAPFVETACAALFHFLASHPEIALPDARKALVVRLLFSLAAHNHLSLGHLEHLLEQSVDPDAVHQDKRVLRIHKILSEKMGSSTA